MPATGTVGAPVRILGNATVRNLGPGTPVLADTTLILLAPGDCLVSPPPPLVIQDTNLILNTSVFTSRVWNVTCAAPGPHDFVLQASVVPDPVQGAVDPDTTNNSGQSPIGTAILN